MRKISILFLLVFSFLQAQQKITLEDIFTDATFSENSLEAFHSMQNGDFFTLLNYYRNGISLDKFDYATLSKIETIVSSEDLGLPSFDNYVFNRDETKVIIGTDTESVFRHSELGIFYVYEIATKKIEKISDHKIQEPTFSPDGSKVAYALNNNLFVKDLSGGKTTQITKDGERNKIINGITDWVYEEEFSFVRAFEWNGNSDKIAFIRFDETDVPEFSMDIYGDQLYPDQLTFKYPKAGENNSLVSLHLYDLSSNQLKKVALGEDQQYYLPRIQWTNEPNTLSVTTLNRHQNNLNLIFVDGKSLKSKVILNEKDNAYVDINDELTFLGDNSFIWMSERDGFYHLYHYNSQGKLINQITKGDWEVTNYYGFDEKSKTVFYQSTEEGSVNRSVYSIKINGSDKRKLSEKVGTNDAFFSNSFNYYVNEFSNVNSATSYTLNDAKSGIILKSIVDNSELEKKNLDYKIPNKEISELKTKNGTYNMFIMKPIDFDPSKKYPLLMYQYSGPGSQSVSNSWFNYRDYYHAMLVQNGFIVAVVDGRGTGFKGRDFKKVTYKELGKYEIADQIEAALELGKLNYIDQNRIGIWGWSYGGYMSSLAITKGADVFKMAIAVAPVTSWRFYDAVYTERYMQTPQENANGYDQNSPLNFAHLLKGDYLLIHGSGDDNVHVQNSMRMVNALIKENKDFDFFIYPDRSHGINEGENTRLHLFEKMTKFIRESLGKTEGFSSTNP
ncbi:S9 family peptidase [Namhaeicola litoreus]|uniref:S9 family peptidase n=1 Tax=Namhaeicola litoreus TaxID=1052145 RepID=A0ABW3Y0E2_9FLAO